jgi:hypothetical protein
LPTGNNAWHAGLHSQTGSIETPKLKKPYHMKALRLRIDEPGGTGTYFDAVAAEDAYE